MLIKRPHSITGTLTKLLCLVLLVACALGEEEGDSNNPGHKKDCGSATDQQACCRMEDCGFWVRRDGGLQRKTYCRDVIAISEGLKSVYKDSCAE